MVSPLTPLSETITRDHTTFATILTLLSGAHKVDQAYASLLGSPLGDGRCISKTTVVKTAVLKRVEKRFVALSAHDAFILLRDSFAISKLQVLLPALLCYKSKACVEYYGPLQSIMGEMTSTAVASNDRAWKPSSLPVKLGGLGIHSVVEAAPSAYLALLHATSTLVEAILPVTFISFRPSLLDDVLSCWSKGHDFQTPVGVCAFNSDPGTS